MSGIEAQSTTRLYEIWLEQKWGTKLALRAGQLAADTEFMTAKYMDVFTNSSLVLAGNSVARSAKRRPFTAAGRDVLGLCLCAADVPVDHIGKQVDVIIADNPDKWEQAMQRPQLLGWFVDQVIKKINGQADPEYVFQKVRAAFEAGKCSC